MSTCQMKAIVSNAGCNQNYEYLLLILAARAQPCTEQLSLGCSVFITQFGYQT